MKRKTGRFVYWTPRILSIIFILFLALFSLDVFEGNYGFWGTMLALFMHNLPSLILLVALLIAWRREWVGGVAFILGGLLYIAFVLNAVAKTGFEWYYLAWIAQISGIAFFIGIMFLVGWYRKR